MITICYCIINYYIFIYKLLFYFNYSSEDSFEVDESEFCLSKDTLKYNAEKHLVLVK